MCVGVFPFNLLVFTCKDEWTMKDCQIVVKNCNVKGRVQSEEIENNNLKEKENCPKYPQIISDIPRERR